MQFPLALSDLMLLLFMMSIILIITTEELSPYYGKINILIDRRKLRSVTLVMLIVLAAFIIPTLA
jgi:hypothetical protein